MKNLKFLTFALAVSVIGGGALSACSESTTQTSHFEAADSSAAIADVSGQTCESGQELSADEEAQAENSRRNKIAQQYSIYEAYGMTYDKEKDRFFYNKQIVRYFKDPVEENHSNSFFYDDGTVDIESVRDADGKLTGLKELSDKEYAARTRKGQEKERELEEAGISNLNGSYEMGDSDWQDESLTEYVSFGVSYDKSADTWMYNGRKIQILYDAGYHTYYNAGLKEGCNLEVIRNKKGEVEKLVEVEKEELEKYVE